MIQVNCTIINIVTPPVLKLDTGSSYTAFLESDTRAIFKISDVDGNQVGDFFDLDQKIYSNYIIPKSPGAYEGPILTYTSPVAELHIVEDQFLLPDGTNYNWKGSIDFMLYKRSLDGVEIEPLLQQRFDAGSRCCVTLMQASFIERFVPSEYGLRYFDHAIPFANALKNVGFYWMPIVYADEQVINSGHDFVYKLAEIFHDHYWILPSLGNEWPKNGFNPSNFTRPNTNNLWSNGSSLSDAPPVFPSWDWKEWHPRRTYSGVPYGSAGWYPPKVLFGNDDAWYVKQGYDEKQGVVDKIAPCVVTEPIGFWNQNVPDRRSNDPNLARVVGGTSIYFARGSNFMSEQGLRCEMWDTITEDCAIQFFSAINQ